MVYCCVVVIAVMFLLYFLAFKIKYSYIYHAGYSKLLGGGGLNGEIFLFCGNSNRN